MNKTNRAKDRDPVRRYGCMAFIIYCAFILGGIVVLAVSLCGCTRYVPMETVRTEYRDRDVERVVTDTVREERLMWIKGDTVREIRDREHLRLISVHDTCYVELRDTVREPYPVERPLSRWEQTKQDIRGMAIGALAIALCAAVVWLARKFRR